MPEQESQSRRFDDMNSKIIEIGKNVKDIHDLLDGDGFASGMVAVLKDNQTIIRELADAKKNHDDRLIKLEKAKSDHDMRIKSLEKSRDRAIWTAGGMLGPAAYGIWEFIRKYIVGVLVIFLFTGCVTQKQREDITHRYLRENPVVLADLAALHFPPVIKDGDLRVDTLIKRDTLLRTDTLNRRDTLTIREIITINNSRVDTIYEVARIASLEASLRALNAKLDISLQREEIVAQRSHNRLYWLIGISVAFLIVVVIVFKLSGVANKIGRMLK